MRYYVANAPMRRHWSLPVVVAVIVCGASSHAAELGRVPVPKVAKWVWLLPMENLPLSVLSLKFSLDIPEAAIPHAAGNQDAFVFQDRIVSEWDRGGELAPDLSHHAPDKLRTIFPWERNGVLFGVERHTHFNGQDHSGRGALIQENCLELNGRSRIVPDALHGLVKHQVRAELPISGVFRHVDLAFGRGRISFSQRKGAVGVFRRTLGGQHSLSRIVERDEKTGGAKHAKYERPIAVASGIGGGIRGLPLGTKIGAAFIIALGAAWVLFDGLLRFDGGDRGRGLRRFASALIAYALLIVFWVWSGP